jgi:hypothetical protein
MKNILIQITAPWRRHFITLLFISFVFFSHFASARSKIHWIGRYHRPRRLERALMILLFVYAFILLQPYQFALWSTVLGGTMAIFINLHMIYRLIPRRKHHWIDYG